MEKVVKRKPKFIERHVDDCGDNLQGLGDINLCQCCGEYSASSDEEQGIPLIQHNESDYLPIYWFAPFLREKDQLQMRTGSKFLLFNIMSALITHKFFIH